MNSRTLTYIFMILVLIGISICQLMITHERTPYRPSTSPLYPIRGIDVSKHTRRIDWATVVRRNIHFAYIKATEGASYTDRNYRRNFAGAKSAGLKVGVYHFYRFNRSGEAQARNFLRNVDIHDQDLPLVLDVEEWGNHNHSSTHRQIIEQLHVFIHTVEQETNQRLLIYTNRSTYLKYIQGNFPDHPIWICRLRTKPENDMNWILWQYTHTGIIKNVDGWVDFNYFRGTVAEWEAWLQEVKKPLEPLLAGD